MHGLLIANEDREARDRLADVFADDDIQVETTDSVVNGLEGILNKTIQVVVLGGDFDETHVAKFVPLLKKCNRNLSIILISDEISITLLRRIRKEGIFYHALKPAGEEGWEEIKQAVHCAFKTYDARQSEPRITQSKEVFMNRVKTVLTSLSLVLMAVPAFAADTTKTYTSGILVLMFVGFCALLVVMQLIPAVRQLFLLTKDAAKKSKYSDSAVTVKKQ
ncbi:Response regulator receiver domain-containing protein [Malonomonas rubra DSM 5091]|uniref:Response regulator receiver domain-containing protein n=1 Tax=Malonomonas rubra DSM 5091 TaxID=1122189 RepID=A0A1M6HH11_MALRU|nr:response regulator [Malonomonas rubra]SHJ21424.1 Response regulator receiver domain-containing protein [Malonomonas rubra DSM 5091]